MRELGVTFRDLAPKLSTANRKLTHTTIWAWTKSIEGTPPPLTYTEEVNRKLAAALDLTPEVLAQAFEDSRRHLILSDKQSAQRGPLSILRKLFADSKQEIWTSQELIRLIDEIQGR